MGSWYIEPVDVLRAVAEGRITAARQGQWYRQTHYLDGRDVERIIVALDDLVLVERSNIDPPRITDRGRQVLDVLGPDGRFSLPARRGRRGR